MNRIRELRVAARLTQKELADKFYVNQTAVSQWERGATSPNNATLENLAIFFDVSVGYLLGMEDYRGTPPQGRNDYDDGQGDNDRDTNNDHNGKGHNNDGKGNHRRHRRNGNDYHRRRDSRKEIESTKDDLSKAGYKACGTCNPW